MDTPVEVSRKERVLLVEDDTILANLLTIQFQHHHMECVVASSGEDALQFLKVDRDFCVILLDLSLPGMDGFEVLSNIKNEPQTASIPVVIVSNFGQEKDIAWGEKLGAQKFINKVSAVPGDIVDAARAYCDR